MESPVDVAELVEAIGGELDHRLADVDADLARHYPGGRPGRQPVHTVYVPVDRFRDKLRSEPVEDVRIDREDGYGSRPDDEEDADAVRAADELAAARAAG